MTDAGLKAIIDKLWDNFWSSGISNPISVIEQMTYLIFMKLYDGKEIQNANIAEAQNKEYTGFFDKKDKYKDEDGKEKEKSRQHLRWSEFKQLSDPEEMLKLVRDEAFPLLSEINPIFKNAVWHINKPSLLDEAIKTLDGIDFSDKGDTKGDLYEYMLSKLSQAGTNGQFRTPRHIINMMVKLVDPKPTDKICDPACGTAGFLCSALHYMLEKATSDSFKEISPIFADKLSESDRKKLETECLYGFDFDSTMVRIATMNLILHNIDAPNINNLDTLSKNYNEPDKYDVVLANPPFTGSLDASDINPKLKATVSTKKTELLFMALFTRLLNMGGRGAVIIPTGVLSTESKAHKSIRETLVENNQLEAVISMPSGVFKPYAGVATAVLVFTKGGQTENVWFYEMENDGKSLDDKRNDIDKNDIPDIVEKYKTKTESEKSFNVSLKELQENEYNLLPSRYKKVEYKPMEFEYTPQEYIDKLLEMEKQSITLLEGLKEKLGEGLCSV